MRFKSHTLNPAKNESTIFDVNQNEPEWAKTAPSIPEFYADQEILVTGGSGFMGKVLIEKLLRSCRNLKTIYVLMRPKKGKTIEERLQVVTNLPLFAPLRKHDPHVLDKLVPIAGDVAELRLGLATSDWDRMKNVSIIFHSAASVRFDDSLKYAVFMNTRGTREMVKFAKTLTNLKVIMHVSTTYSHPELNNVPEEIHQPYVDWQKTIEICEGLDDEALEILTPKYTRFMPNTYTFTKALAEQIVDDNKDELPFVMFRPSIVISSMKEPFPGWIDNFNGPVGLLIGSGLGVTRTMYCNPDNIADFTPVDICIKAMIIAAWKRAHESSGSLPIYNCCTSNQRSATMEQIIQMGLEIQDEIPLDKMLWAPGGSLTRSRMWNFLRVILVHLLPALLIDLALKFKGYKPFLAKLQRKIYQANVALHYFILNNWNFANDNFMNLSNDIKLVDKKNFEFIDFLEHDMILYFRYAALGGRRYLLGEKDENIPKARRHYYRMKWLDIILKTLVLTFLFFYIFIKKDFLLFGTTFCKLIGYYNC